MAAIESNVEQLVTTLKTLDLHWQQLCANWDDEVRRDFQHTFYEPLEHHTLLAARQMARLADVVTQAKQRVH